MNLCMNINWTAISAIASAVMIIITGISIICSNNQNRKNRQANNLQNFQNRGHQIKLLSAELAQSRLDSIRNSISRLISILEDENLILVSSCLEKESQPILNTIRSIGANVRIEVTNLRLALSAMGDEISKMYIGRIDEMYYSFRNMLLDLAWMAEYSPADIQYDSWDNEDYGHSAKIIEEDVNQYIKHRLTDNPSIDKYDATHIWNIFKKYKFSHQKFHDIWQERILYFDIERFEADSIEYIKKELDIITNNL